MRIKQLAESLSRFLIPELGGDKALIAVKLIEEALSPSEFRRFSGILSEIERKIVFDEFDN